MLKTTLTKEECMISIPAMYDLICEKIHGCKGEDYQCNKVYVGEQIFEDLRQKYIDDGGESAGFSMLWLCYGPKATLDGYEVEVEEDWCKLLNGEEV